jgi:hypothetical protein
MTDGRKNTTPPPEMRRVTVEIDILVPTWSDVEPGDDPTVTLGPVADWRIVDDLHESVWVVVRDAILEDVTEEYHKRLAAELEAAEDAKHDRGDWEHERRRDRELDRRLDNE